MPLFYSGSTYRPTRHPFLSFLHSPEPLQSTYSLPSLSALHFEPVQDDDYMQDILDLDPGITLRFPYTQGSSRRSTSILRVRCLSSASTNPSPLPHLSLSPSPLSLSPTSLSRASLSLVSPASRLSTRYCRSSCRLAHHVVQLEDTGSEILTGSAGVRALEEDDGFEDRNRTVHRRNMPHHPFRSEDVPYMRAYNQMSLEKCV